VELLRHVDLFDRVGVRVFGGLTRDFAGEIVEKKKSEPSGRLVSGRRVKRVMKRLIADTKMRPGAKVVSDESRLAPLRGVQWDKKAYLRG
jgi:hypothetical protein